MNLEIACPFFSIYIKYIIESESKYYDVIRDKTNGVYSFAHIVIYSV